MRSKSTSMAGIAVDAVGPREQDVSQLIPFDAIRPSIVVLV